MGRPLSGAAQEQYVNIDEIVSRKNVLQYELREMLLQRDILVALGKLRDIAPQYVQDIEEKVNELTSLTRKEIEILLQENEALKERNRSIDNTKYANTVQSNGTINIIQK